MLALHGGRVGRDDRLRAGAGGLRVHNRDLEVLLHAISSEHEWRLELREEPARMLAPGLSSEPAGIVVDPPIPFSQEAKRAIERRQRAAGEGDDSWRYDQSDRDTFSSSGAAVAGAAGATAAQGAQAQPSSRGSAGGTSY